MRARDILHQFKGVKRSGDGWTARCPAHDDGRNSLSIGDGEKGRFVLYCHAGCTFEDIVRAVGIEREGGSAQPRRIVAEYDYRDEQGALLYQSLRYDPKGFMQRKPGGAGWHYKLNGTRRVLYRLPELLGADPASTVFIVEGEKDADRLASLGLVATTNAGGAGKWRADYNEHLRGRRVCIIPDNDETGANHARQVARSLQNTAARVCILDLPNLPPKGDVSDWLDASGTVEELRKLAEAAPEWEPNAGPSATRKQSPSSDAPLRVVRMSDVEPEQVEWLWHPYIPLGKLTILDGEEGIGKSWLLCALAGRISRGEPLPFADEVVPGNVLMLSGSEDGLADTIRPRLDSVGADCGRVFAVAEPFTFDQSGLIKLAALVAEIQPSLVVIDPLFDYVAARTDINRDNESRAATKPLREIAERFGCAVVAVRHIGKSKGNGEARAAGLGGIGFRAAGRSGLLVGCDPQDRTKRAMVLTKSNLADKDEAKAVGFTIEAGKFFWLRESYLTAEIILSWLEDQETRNAAASATAVLRDLLRDGARPAKDVQADMRAAGFTDDVTRRARERLGVKPRKKGGFFGGDKPKWWWGLPSPEDGTQGAEDGKTRASCHLQSNGDGKSTYDSGLAEDGRDYESCHLQEPDELAERAAIMEVDGGLSREEAERRAQAEADSWNN